jgi:hypothetical protein
MTEEENHIDQFFKKKLSDRVSTPPEDIWEGIESAMPKSLFFRFRYEYMNVYYAGFIAGCFLFSGGALIYSIKNYYKTVQVHVLEEEADDSLTSPLGRTTELQDRNHEKSGMRRGRFYGLSEQVQRKEADQANTIAMQHRKDSLAASAQSLSADTSKISQQVLDPPVEDKPKQKKPKKVVYVTDYDTIIKYDTLRTKKKRK